MKPPDTSNLGPHQRELLRELEKSPWMLIWRGPTLPGAPRYVWSHSGHAVKARTVEPLFDRGLVKFEVTGRGGSTTEMHVVLSRAGLKWAARHWRERADARQGMWEAWRNRAQELEARVKELGG